MSRLGTVLCFVFAITIFSQCSPLRAENTVPVMMWGESAASNSETTAVNPLVKTTRKEFNEILDRVLDGLPPVLVLSMDNLCVEDIARYREQIRQEIGGANYRYMLAVEEPLTVLKELSYNRTEDVNIESIADGQMVINPISNLDSLSEIFSEIKNDSPARLTILTGKACGYSKSKRVRREALAPNSTEFIVRTDRVLFYSSKPLELKVGDEEPVILPTIAVGNSRGNGTQVVLRMQFTGAKSNIILEFFFHEKTPGYHYLQTVKYQEKHPMNTTANIVFPFKFSYHCSQMTTFTGSDVQLKIANLQVEVDGESNRFNDAYDCVGFTTIPIWTGIFVTAILAAIMIWGLSMIIDIRTMDRFDDPKGKTITISTAE